jgi:hypothetical protein
MHHVPISGAVTRDVRSHARLHTAAVLLLLAIVGVRLLLPAVADRNFGLLVSPDRGGWTSDFAAHLTFATAVWRGEAGYDVRSHLRVTSTRAGRTVAHALPFGYSPAMLWILGPFCLLPAAWAYVVWSLLGIVAIWWMVRPAWALWLAAAFFSPASLSCFKLGQTACLTVLGLFVLMSHDLDAHPSQPPTRGTRALWLDAVILWALTAKPPLALTGGAALLAARRWRSVGLAVGLSLISSAALTPLLGITWLKEYAHLLTHYDLNSADPAYVWSLVPETMGNLRAVLHVVCGLRDSTASGLSSGAWVLALAGIGIAAARRQLAIKATWGLAVLAYLLFCPHVTSTDELHLVLLLVLLTYPDPAVTRPIRWMGIVLILGVLYLTPGLGCPTIVRVPLAFAGKLPLAALLWACWQRRASAGTGPEGRAE